MNEVQAGGQNMHRQPSRAESLLENGLADAADGIAGLIAEARAVDPAADEYGHARSRAYTDAVALLKASAKVGHTIAELRGSKFEHTINVRREAARATRPAWHDDEDDEDPDPAPQWEYRQYKGHDYDPTIRFKGDQVFVWGLGRMNVPDDWDEERWKAGLPQKSEENTPLAISAGSNGNPDDGTPPLISEGSNGNFEPCARGEPEIRSA